MTSGALIRGRRQRAGLSQSELATRAGTSQPTVSAYESGARNPSAPTLKRLLDAAAVRPSVLLGRSRDQVLGLCAEHGATDVSVFGSVARAEDEPGSDVDLLVTFRPGTTLVDHVNLVAALEDLLGIGVDVISSGGLGAHHDAIRADARPL